MKTLICISAIMAIYSFFMPIFMIILAPEYFVNEMVYGMFFAAGYLAVMAAWSSYADRKEIK